MANTLFDKIWDAHVVQHLKAYASTDDLNQECIDPRFHYVQRGCAPTVEDLGGHWAPSDKYGTRIVDIMDYVLSMDGDEPKEPADDPKVALLEQLVAIFKEILGVS